MVITAILQEFQKVLRCYLMLFNLAFRSRHDAYMHLLWLGTCALLDIRVILPVCSAVTVENAVSSPAVIFPL